MPDIPVKFLLDSSNGVLGEYELSRLNHAANLRKELRAVVEQIIDDTAEARFARWLMEHKEELSHVLNVGQGSFEFFSEEEESGRA